MCISTIEAPVFATTLVMSGSNLSALISFTIVAPADRASSATFAFVVSTEIITSLRFLIPSITGITQSSSSWSGIGLAPGRLDSPPMSMISAPSASICSPCFTAAVGWAYLPPS